VRGISRTATSVYLSLEGVINSFRNRESCNTREDDTAALELGQPTTITLVTAWLIRPSSRSDWIFYNGFSGVPVHPCYVPSLATQGLHPDQSLRGHPNRSSRDRMDVSPI